LLLAAGPMVAQFKLLMSVGLGGGAIGYRFVESLPCETVLKALCNINAVLDHSTKWFILLNISVAA
jgi:hypothetical protein